MGFQKASDHIEFIIDEAKPKHASKAYGCGAAPESESGISPSPPPIRSSNDSNSVNSPRHPEGSQVSLFSQQPEASEDLTSPLLPTTKSTSNRCHIAGFWITSLCLHAGCAALTIFADDLPDGAISALLLCYGLTAALDIYTLVDACNDRHCFRC